METATKLKRKAQVAPQTFDSAFLECEVLAVVEESGKMTTEQIKSALPHRSGGQVINALRRQSGCCLQSVRDGKESYWCLA